MGHYAALHQRRLRRLDLLFAGSRQRRQLLQRELPGEVYYNAPTTIGALRFWQDMIYKDKVMPSGVLNSKQISAAFFSGKLGMAMLSTGALGFMRENTKDFELGVAMMPAQEQRAVPIGGASHR